MNRREDEKQSPAAPRAFVTGWPIDHSRSPVIHRYWLNQHGLPGSYEKIATKPGALPDLLARIRSGELVGGNVTIPHKEVAAALVDRLDRAALAIGAVNTLWLEGDTLWGGNTDAYGFTANLDQASPDWRRNANSQTALIIGAGGAAGAIIHALVEAQFKTILIANRTLSRAEEKAVKFGSSCRAIALSDASAAAADVSLIINTSSLGMGDGETPPIDFNQCSNNCLITDIVYTPLMTPMLLAAQHAGLRTVDGLGMLLHQAAPGFERWFDVRPQVDKGLREAVLATMEAR